MIEKKYKIIIDSFKNKSTRELGELLDYVVSNKNSDNKINILIYLLSFELSKRFFYMINFSYNLVDDYSKKVALSFCNIIDSTTIKNSSLFTIRNLCRELNKIKFPSKNKFEYVYYKNEDIVSKLLMKTSLEEIISSLPDKYKGTILYCIYNMKDFKTILNLYDDLEKFLIYTKLKTFLDLMTGVKDEYIKINHMNSQLSNTLLLSGLYKFNPRLLILLTLVGNIQNLFQFCELFGGEKFEIPKIDEVKNILNNISGVLSKFDESKTLSIKDKELLLYLSTNINLENNLDFKLTPIIEEYISNIISNSSKNYEKKQNKIIDKLNLSNPENVKKLYEILDSELTKNLFFIKELNEAIENFGKITELINLYKT